MTNYENVSTVIELSKYEITHNLLAHLRYMYNKQANMQENNFLIEYFFYHIEYDIHTKLLILFEY